jgi:hypothetical protein
VGKPRAACCQPRLQGMHSLVEKSLNDDLIHFIVFGVDIVMVVFLYFYCCFLLSHPSELNERSSVKLHHGDVDEALISTHKVMNGGEWFVFVRFISLIKRISLVDCF